MLDLTKSTIAVTGSGGFLGRHVLEQLINHGVNDLGELHPVLDELDHEHGFICIRSNDFDLTNENRVAALYAAAKPDIVIHLAADVGGIGINRQKPGTFYYNNLVMGAMLMEYARRRQVSKFVAVGTVCAYPKHAEVPFKEESLWNGYPEETNAAYGIAKKAMLVQAQAYRQQFGFNAIYLIPVNLYGPGDNFDLDTSHVIPALIRKCLYAKEHGHSEIECWGTGNATREFLFVQDAAAAIVAATINYDESEPINLGSGTEIKISDLVKLIAKLTGYDGRIIFNDNFPDGQPRRCLDTSKATAKFGFTAATKLEEGLIDTINWYKHFGHHDGITRHVNIS